MENDYLTAVAQSAPQGGYSPAQLLTIAKRAGIIPAGTLPTTTPKPITSTPATPPANPMAGFSNMDTSQADYEALKKANEDLGNANPTQQEYSSVAQRYQAQVDALNQLYATERQRLVEQGNAQMGQVGAIQARQGLLGTGFAGQQTQAQTEATNKMLQAADAEHNAKIAAIYGNISKEAQDMASRRFEAAKSGAQALVDLS